MTLAPLFSSVGEGFVGSDIHYTLVLLYLLYVWLPIAPAAVTGAIGGVAIRRVDSVLAAALGFGIGFAAMCGNLVLFAGILRVDSFVRNPAPYAPATAVEIAAQAGGAAVGVIVTLAILWVWRAAERDS